jgi:multiple sugar transport system ATP-binding protein
MSSVSLRHVYRKFGDVIAVNDVNIDIMDKEFLVLVGPSGCGKSTTLRLIAGLEEISAGEIYIGERLVNDVPPKDRDIAMVFQSYALYPHMNVYDNLAFGLRRRKTPKADVDRRVRATAQSLGIESLLTRKPKQLSGGQRQRVAVGRAIVREPKVFLMDEPLSNLDAKLRVETRAYLIKLHQRLQTTVVYVTHDQTEAMTMGSRIAVMKDGFLQQLDTPQEVYDHPANVFVAGFIGSPAMNFFDARLVSDANTMFADTGVFRVKLPPDKRERLAPYSGNEVIFGIRPEDIFDRSLVSNPESTDVATVNVEVVEHMGSELYVYFSAGKNQFVARLDPRSKAIAGQTMDLLLDASHVHLFDKASQTCISNPSEAMRGARGSERGAPLAAGV